MTVRTFEHFIDGRFVPSRSGRSFDDIDPVTGMSFGRVAEGGPAEVQAAVAAARAALGGPWSKLTGAARAEVLHRVADGITQRADEFIAAEVADTGKPRSLAAHVDIPRAAANLEIGPCAFWR